MYKAFSKLLLLTLVFLSVKTFGQETTSSLGGSVLDEKGGIVPGATITAVHTPTGAVNKTQTNKKGLFNLTNLKPGGPYEITISFVGFKEEKS